MAGMPQIRRRRTPAASYRRLANPGGIDPGGRPRRDRCGIYPGGRRDHRRIEITWKFTASCPSVIRIRRLNFHVAVELHVKSGPGLARRQHRYRTAHKSLPARVPSARSTQPTSSALEKRTRAVIRGEGRGPGDMRGRATASRGQILVIPGFVQRGEPAPATVQHLRINPGDLIPARTSARWLIPVIACSYTPGRREQEYTRSFG